MRGYPGGVHPIEHLRYLARSGDAPAAWLVPEAAEALHGLAHDRNALVMGSRKLLESIPLCGPLWWLCGHTLLASDPYVALDELVATFEADPTSLQLSLALSDADDPVIYEAALVGQSKAVVWVDDYSWPDEPGSSGASWLTVSIGTVVPDQIFTAATTQADFNSNATERRAGAYRLIELAAIDQLIRPTGCGTPSSARSKPDVSLVPELMSRR